MTSNATAVERIALAPDLSISRVLTGLWQIADMERDGGTVDPGHAAAAMGEYVAAGLTTFDMADHYGSAELIAGAFREGHQSAPRAQLLTKWVPKPGPVSMAEVRAAVDRARSRLRVDVIDLLQFHAWNYADPSWLETLFLLQELKREGSIRHLGLTNVDAAHLHVVVASGIEVVSNQVSFSLIDRRAARDLAPLCAANGVHLLAYGTLAGGWLTERWLGRDEPDWERSGTWSQMKYGRFIRAAGGWERTPARAAGGRGGGRAARRLHRERRQPIRSRSSRRRRRHHRCKAGRARAHRRHVPRLCVPVDRRRSCGARRRR